MSWASSVQCLTFDRLPQGQVCLLSSWPSSNRGENLVAKNTSQLCLYNSNAHNCTVSINATCSMCWVKASGRDRDSPAPCWSVSFMKSATIMSCQMPISINRAPQPAGWWDDGFLPWPPPSSSSPICRSTLDEFFSFLFHAWTSTSVVICWPA